nr:MAG TPA: hypothetical protein [Caudoviricetes sp.]
MPQIATPPTIFRLQIRGKSVIFWMVFHWIL